MKIYNVIYRPEAVSDIFDVDRWVHSVSLDPVTAQRFTDRIWATCEKIGNAPLGGRPRDDLLPGLRTVPFEKKAIIAYRVDGETVEIVNVFYGGSDLILLRPKPAS